MKIGVCVKQVPASEARLRVSRDGSWIEEEEIPFEINKSDEFAVEEALRLAEQHGGEVIVVSLGPERAREALRKTLALGAARAVLLSDAAFAGGDAMANGRALAAVLRRAGCDLVITGSQSDDVGAAATGSIVAGFLGWPHAWLVMGVELEPATHSVKIKREMESGMNEMARLPLPAVLEVQAGINHPRYASLKGIMAAKKKEIAALSPADLGLDAGQVGRAGSRTVIVAVALPDTGREAVMLEGDSATVAKLLIDKLQQEAKVIR